MMVIYYRNDMKSIGSMVEPKGAVWIIGNLRP
jgi:hypothetical protein